MIVAMVLAGVCVLCFVTGLICRYAGDSEAFLWFVVSALAGIGAVAVAVGLVKIPM